ncbi:hypothetical protein ACHAXT_002501 [Thalassiosira profunda]
MSDHALHMRRAAEDLRRRMEGLGERGAGIFAPDEMKDNWIHGLIQSACLASRKCREEREDALQEVGKRLDRNCNNARIDTVHVHQDGASWCIAGKDTPKNICQFKRQYCVRNVPCLVRGLDQTHFADVSAQWCSAGNTSSGDTDEGERIGETSKINTEWFRRHVGDDTLVPVRIDSICKKEDGLDNEGRAQECETVQMKMSEWITQCKHTSSTDDANMQRRYLKDWHLVQYLSEKHPEGTPLYTTPGMFERDILNSFLTRYGGGDWKFVYWGPAGSQTRLHSDVLHSFSWSYNVVGKKKWRFHVPSSYDETTPGKSTCFEVIQHSGEAIFVPATWKHEVVNLIETISINHNWITSANVDLAWRCLLVEMAAIDTEVNEWGIPADDYGARENMLRGCVGLNVSMFALMILLEIADLLEVLVSS